jgi:HTH-type transcriptional regulator/antitoxin HigA
MTNKDDDNYFKLVKRFPLRPIKNDEQNALAAEICDELTDSAVLTVAEQDYLEVLTILVSEYESKWSDESDSMSPRELIQYLMKENNLVQKDLVPQFGTASRVSEYLNGERRLSLEQAKKLANRFSLNIAALIEPTKSLQPKEAPTPEHSGKSWQLLEETMIDLIPTAPTETWFNDALAVALSATWYTMPVQPSPAETFSDSDNNNNNNNNNNIVAFPVQFYQQESQSAIGARTSIGRRKVEI